MDTLKRLVRRLLFPVYGPFIRMRHGQTLGVRGIVVDARRRVLLVRHSYTPGWSFPGGGVRSGETLREALARELREETGIALDTAPRLHGVFANFRILPGDHVAVFVAERWHRESEPGFGIEITERRFFPLDALPDSVTPGTRRRLDELRDGAPPAETW